MSKIPVIRGINKILDVLDKLKPQERLKQSDLSEINGCVKKIRLDLQSYERSIRGKMEHLHMILDNIEKATTKNQIQSLCSLFLTRIE